MLSSSSWLSARRLLPLMGPRITTTVTTTATCSLSTAVAQNRSNCKELQILRLNNLQDNPGAVKKKRRVGRGIGSSKGKTCGKGHKGQRARNRSSIPTGFEGGQTKLWKLIPKRGFNNKFHQTKRGDMDVINLGTIQDYIDMGRFGSLVLNGDDSLPLLGIVDFIQAGIIKDKAEHPGLKLLSKGKERFKTPVQLLVNRASQAAIEAAEDVGGLVTTVHLNRLAMRTLIRPKKFETTIQQGEDDDSERRIVRVLPKQARPPPKLQPYYTSFKNRGYLCPEVQMRDFLQGRPDMAETFQKALQLELELDASVEEVHNNAGNDKK